MEEMKRVILGTAGHVDHGKTALVRALTGVDTDRLPEEKARGISIELGFAEFRLPGGRTAGVIDVPGHERFIKNMLAGATGVDIVLLVVAADEGVMPQTKEHLDIVNLLGTKRGIKVITKADAVDEDWLTLVEDDIETLVKGTFLEAAPTVATSAVTGLGLDQLKSTIDKMIDEVQSKDALAFPRLPVDRSFSVPGYGTVVTGTLQSGQLRVEDKVEVLPAGILARVRNLQVHGKSISTASAGQRVAVNLAGVDREEVPRGQVLTYPGWQEPCYQFAARLRLLDRAPQELENLTRVHLHYGTAEALAHVVLLEADALRPGEDALVRIRAEEPVVVTRGDRFIIRSYSPVTTIGGGVTIAAPSAHRRNSHNAIQDLLMREKQDLMQDIIALTSRPPYLLNAQDIANKLGLQRSAVEQFIKQLVERKALTQVGQSYIAETALSALLGRLGCLSASSLKARPLKLSLSKEEARRLAVPEVDTKNYNLLLAEASKRGILTVLGDRVRPDVAGRELTSRLKCARDSAVKRLLENPYSPPTPEELVDGLGLSAEESLDLIANLCESEEATRISDSLIMEAGALSRARQKVEEKLQAQGTISVSEFRDLLGTSRKYALPILEYFDQTKVTRRKGDERIPYFSRG